MLLRGKKSRSFNPDEVESFLRGSSGVILEIAEATVGVK